MKKILILLLLFVSANASAQIKFDTDFESGSLGKVELIDSANIRISDKDSVMHLSYNIESRFDPINPVDTTLPPSARWFYFRITGAKNKYIYLNFKNTDPLRAVYSYDNKTFMRFAENEAVRSKVSKRFIGDTVYIAYFTPYTNSFLQSQIDKWKNHGNVNCEIFGYSKNNRPMHLLTITDKRFDDKNKHVIWLHARTHTSETPSSWHLDGMIESLLYSAAGEEYCKHFVFYIVPFANPDGVAEGLSRSNSTGVNQEINWNKDDFETVIEVKNLKKKMTELTTNRSFDMMLNLHSQVANSATYWIHTIKSTSEESLRGKLLLAYLNMFENDYLKPSELLFSKIADRYPEGWFWNKNEGKTLAVTFETPYSFYGKRDITTWVDTDNLRDFGRATLDAVAMYFNIAAPDRIIIENTNTKQKGKWTSENSNNFVFLGNDYVRSNSADATITYRYKNLDAGKYKIYRWEVGKNNEKPSENPSRWVLIDEYTHKKQSNFKLKLQSKSPGEIFDAIMLVKDSE